MSTLARYNELIADLEQYAGKEFTREHFEAWKRTRSDLTVEEECVLAVALVGAALKSAGLERRYIGSEGGRPN